MRDSHFQIEQSDSTLSWQVIKERVSLGYELQELDESEIGEDEILRFNDAIIISPDYQREYRSTIADESSLIESALIGIPIPPIFLANERYKKVQVLNVVDGQHRIRAFFRFLSNMFALQGLTIESDKVDLKFNQLDVSVRANLQSKGITAITFRNFPGKDFELEIFSRYNKGTKPLTPQDIRHAVYDSKVNHMVNDFCRSLIDDTSAPLAKAYVVSKDRFQKKTCQENIFVILSILQNGVIQTYVDEDEKPKQIYKSPQYAEYYMREKSQIEDDGNSDFNKVKEYFDNFNSFICKVAELCEYPFSKELYGYSKRGNKFQVSLSMIMAGVFKKLFLENNNSQASLTDAEMKEFIKELSQALNNSYLEDPSYNASTTNPIKVDEFVTNFNFTI